MRRASPAGRPVGEEISAEPLLLAPPQGEPVRLEHSLFSPLPREVTAREKTVVEGKKEPEYGEQENDSVDDGFHRGRDEREDVHEPHEKPTTTRVIMSSKKNGMSLERDISKAYDDDRMGVESWIA